MCNANVCRIFTKHTRLFPVVWSLEIESAFRRKVFRSSGVAFRGARARLFQQTAAQSQTMQSPRIMRPRRIHRCGTHGHLARPSAASIRIIHAERTLTEARPATPPPPLLLPPTESERPTEKLRLCFFFRRARARYISEKRIFPDAIGGADFNSEGNAQSCSVTQRNDATCEITVK